MIFLVFQINQQCHNSNMYIQHLLFGYKHPFCYLMLLEDKKRNNHRFIRSYCQRLLRPYHIVIYIQLTVTARIKSNKHTQARTNARRERERERERERYLFGWFQFKSLLGSCRFEFFFVLVIVQRARILTGYIKMSFCSNLYF